MYTLGLRRRFIAQHYLIGGDWGPENERHSHAYTLELVLEGATLDRHGYLVDLVEVEQAVEAVLARYRDRTLNDLEEFQGLNPSVEHFARILAEALNRRIQAPNVTALTVRLWENENAWAAYRLERPH